MIVVMVVVVVVVVVVAVPAMAGVFVVAVRHEPLRIEYRAGT